MQGLKFLTLYALSIPIFLTVDLIWLLLVAQSFYQDRIGHLMEVDWLVATLFYLLFLLGLTIFATYPATEKGNWQVATIAGSLFGFFTYMTYDLTNLATLKDWPLDMVVVDILWGTALGGVVAGVVFYIYSKLRRFRP